MKISKKHRGRLNRKLLPTPLTVLSQLSIRPGRPNQPGYWKLCCPFHKDGKESNPSLNLHHTNGHYRCHACGAKGGDILDFYMQITSLGFIDACISLSAWEDSL
jgi:hypothetical protein